MSNWENVVRGTAMVTKVEKVKRLTQLIPVGLN